MCQEKTLEPRLQKFCMGPPLRFLGVCFPGEAQDASVHQELKRAQGNVKRFLPTKTDGRKSKYSPFVSKNIREAEFVFVRNDNLGKSALTPLYTGPYRVLGKDLKRGVYKLKTVQGIDNVSIHRLKVALPV